MRTAREGVLAAGDFRGRGRMGQHGRLRLSFRWQGERTILKERFASAPFGAVRANYPDGSGVPEVQITNPSGGVLGGDRLALEVDVASGASATVLTQAANKAYRGAEASQSAVLRVEDGAYLEYLPHHLIPYPCSDYRQETKFFLARDATLLAWDAFAAGRLARGERFAFTRLRGRTEIRREDTPEAVDGFDLSGGGEPFGGFSYVAAAYILAPRNLGPLADDLHHYLADDGGLRDVLASASAPAPDLCVVRVLAHDAPALYHALNLAREIARGDLGLPAPARAVSWAPVESSLWR